MPSLPAWREKRTIIFSRFRENRGSERFAVLLPKTDYAIPKTHHIYGCVPRRHANQLALNRNSLGVPYAESRFMVDRDRVQTGYCKDGTSVFLQSLL